MRATGYCSHMKRLALSVICVFLGTAAPAQQPFVTVKPEPAMEAWWLRAEFHPMHTEVRGIPVAQIRRNWCKATEYSRDLFPRELLIENGTDLMAQGELSFAVEGFFDRSRTKQVALVGVYQTCGGEKGSFLLILDEGSKKVRFVDTVPGRTQFAALGASRGSSIVLFHCMECDNASTLRWDRARKKFAWSRR